MTETLVRVQRFLAASTEWINVSEPMTFTLAQKRLEVLNNQYPENAYRIS